MVLEPASFALLMEQTLAYLDAFHSKNPLSTGISKEQLNSGLGKSLPPSCLEGGFGPIGQTNKIQIQNDLVSLSGRTVVLKGEESAAKAQIEEAFLPSWLEGAGSR